jgi:RNA polymerase sigma factor (sigma-70 family)
MKFSTYAVQSIHFALSHERQKNNSSVAMVSLDDPGPAGDGSMVDFIPDRSAVDPSENAASSEIRGRVAVALQNLKVTDAGIVRQYFGIGARQSTLEEIARSAGVTKQRISFVLKRSLKRLRPCLTVVVD